MSARRFARSVSGSRSECSSVWMFARRLAIGVRSSWLASATRWRWASTERSSASSVALKVRARRPSSSVRSVCMRCEVSPSAASSSVRRVKLATGESAVRATRAPRAAPSATPAAPTRSSTSTTRSSWRSTSSRGRASWTAPRSPTPRVNTRRCVPFTVVSVRSSPDPRAAISRARESTGMGSSLPGRRSTPPDGSTIWATPSGPPNGSRLGSGMPAAQRALPAGRWEPLGPGSPASCANRAARSRSELSTSPRSSARTPK